MRENPWLQLQDCGASYSMSATPRWQPNSAAQRNDAMGSNKSHVPLVRPNSRGEVKNRKHAAMKQEF